MKDFFQKTKDFFRSEETLQQRELAEKNEVLKEQARELLTRYNYVNQLVQEGFEQSHQDYQSYLEKLKTTQDEWRKNMQRAITSMPQGDSKEIPSMEDLGIPQPEFEKPPEDLATRFDSKRLMPTNDRREELIDQKIEAYREILTEYDGILADILRNKRSDEFSEAANAIEMMKWATSD
jgi:hypothetical protein